jgi:hypothetical protein
MATHYYTIPEIAKETLAKYPQVDPERMKRAVELADARNLHIAGYDENGEAIPRPSYDAMIIKGSKGWYIIRPKAHKCTCPDCKKGNICKHRLAVYLYRELLRRTYGEKILQPHDPNTEPLPA